MNFNSYWYLGLGIISLLLVVYVCIKNRSIRSLLLFFAMIGIGYLIEIVIYIFLGSYQYYPKFIAHDPYYDSNTGAIASNALALPAAATFIAVFRLRWIWLIFITGFFVGIEWIFLNLGIYTHNWWRLEYTALSLPVYFAAAIMLYPLILKPIKGVIHFLLLQLIIGPVTGTLHILPIMFFSNRYYRPGWFESQAHDTTAFSAVYYMCASTLLIVMVKLHWKYGWLKYVLILAGVTVMTIILKAAGILYSFVWWDPFYYVLLPIVVLIIAEAVNKRLSIGPVSRKH
ncbi:hypothetical protein [Paenibacillus sp. Soil522]|uniref:hypothetical protein n=1 Tax=Paenibacillus sp. Soil522 TaxID=1736388 RepID=UPI0006FBADAE|nr:hypothetical protein [Paenibacillus sp. Soil522]KRE38725.1 hypothetical protein ASG81_19540 [Paenibacillus sp. Soil522]